MRVNYQNEKQRLGRVDMLCGTEDLLSLISTVVLSLSQVTEVQRGEKREIQGIIDVFLNMKVCCVCVPVRVSESERERKGGLD